MTFTTSSNPTTPTSSGTMTPRRSRGAGTPSGRAALSAADPAHALLARVDPERRRPDDQPVESLAPDKVEDAVGVPVEALGALELTPYEGDQTDSVPTCRVERAEPLRLGVLDEARGEHSYGRGREPPLRRATHATHVPAPGRARLGAAQGPLRESLDCAHSRHDPARQAAVPLRALRLRRARPRARRGGHGAHPSRGRRLRA